MEFTIVSVCSLTKVDKLSLVLGQKLGIFGEMIICNEFKKLKPVSEEFNGHQFYLTMAFLNRINFSINFSK